LAAGSGIGLARRISSGVNFRSCACGGLCVTSGGVVCAVARANPKQQKYAPQIAESAAST
jgi:hypothetical protein